jgi:hypothetical protein
MSKCNSTLYMMHAVFSVCFAAAFHLSSMQAAAAWPPECELIPNGSFDEFLDGWALVPAVDVSGNAGFSDSSGIYDATAYLTADGIPFDDRVLALWMVAGAGGFGEPGAADVELRARTTTLATNRYFRLRRGGIFEFEFLGAVGRRIEADVTIEGSDMFATKVFYAGGGNPALGCEFGLSVLGTFDSMLSETYIDLEEAGIPVGSEVSIEIRLRLLAETLDPCQEAITSATLIIDRIEFCDEAPNPADIDRDGDADETDVSLFVSVLLGQNFDPLHSTTSDVNADAYADGRDVAAFVAAYLESGD